MKCVVPLAGPDLLSTEFGLRPLFNWNGSPLIEAVLRNRPWVSALSPSDYIFIIRQVEQVERLEQFLRSTWPGCAIITLSHLTGGAMFTCLAAMALLSPDETVIVDLADIYFEEGPNDPAELMSATCRAVVPVFHSSEQHYSYLLYEGDVLQRAAEKEVISGLASAGVYMFANSTTFLQCAAWSIEHRAEVARFNSLFVCPMINALAGKSGAVTSPLLERVEPVGKIFHA